MDREHKLAHVVAYYLSRYDREALTNLGFKTEKNAWTTIGEKLNVKPNYLKLTRDEYDVVHPWRKGWHKRKMSANVTRIIEAYQESDELTLRGFVKRIISTDTTKSDFDLEILSSVLPSENEKTERTPILFTTRGITGRKAEEEFISQIKSGKIKFPQKVNIKDMREAGCGYDFELIGESEKYLVEVKGMIAGMGGISLTDKEWRTAKKMRDQYYLVVITDIESEPKANIIRNPANVFNPTENIFTVIQVNWSIGKNDLNNLLI